MIRKFLFIRGLPASGKSTMAEHFKKQLSCESWDYGAADDPYEVITKAIDRIESTDEEHTIFESAFVRESDFHLIMEQLTIQYQNFDAQIYVATHQGRPENMAASFIERLRINFQTNEQVITGLRKKYPTVRFFDCSSSFKPPRRTQK